MGVIRIETEGSFGRSKREFRAISHGHAHAVGQAIRYLTSMLCASINRDHELHEVGEKPDKGFYCYEDDYEE